MADAKAPAPAADAKAPASAPAKPAASASAGGAAEGEDKMDSLLDGVKGEGNKLVEAAETHQQDIVKQMTELIKKMDERKKAAADKERERLDAAIKAAKDSVKKILQEEHCLKLDFDQLHKAAQGNMEQMEKNLANANI